SDLLHAADVFRDFSSQILLGLRVHPAAQGHLTAFGVDRNIQAIQAAVEDEAGFHLAGDPGSPDGSSRLVSLVTGLVGGTRFTIDLQFVVYLAYTLGVTRQPLGQLAGFIGIGTALEGNYTVVGINIDVQPFGVAIPQQLGFDGGGGRGIVEAIGEVTVLIVTAVGGFTFDLELVIYFTYAFNTQGHLFGQVPFDIRLDF